jgi:putative DNA primase/helicase
MRGDFEAWVERARSVSIDHELNRRGVKLRRVGAERVGPCPKCGGDDRFAINTAKGVWHCRGCDKGGDGIELVQHLDGVDFIAACTTLTGQPPPKANNKSNGKDTADTSNTVVTSFEYQNTDGGVAFAVDRIEFQNADGSFVLKDGKREKMFRQRRPDPDHPGGWLPNVDGVPVVPYRLPQVQEAVAAGQPVLIVEGEAKVDLLWSWSVAATCCAGGAKKWKPEHSEFLRGADVFLLPDNDNAGWEHIHKVGASLSTIARSIRVVALTDLPLKGDVIDWARAGGTRERLDELLASAPIWRLPTATEQKDKAKKQEDELLDALAKTQGLDYVRQRREAAKELGVSSADIDKEVKTRRELMAAAPLYGHWITEPWPEPVDGDSLLRDLIFCFRKYVICLYEDSLTKALWTCFAWVHNDVARHSPILLVTSAEPESGKTTTLSVLSYLVPRAITSVDISDAALYRTIQRWLPSFIIDEFDTVLASEEKQELRSIINSGHVRGQGVIRCIGDDRTPELFPTFAPKVIGLVGRKLPASTLSRSIVIELRRRKKDEAIEEFAYEDDNELADLRRRLLRWSLDNAETLRAAKVSMPSGFDNRRSDNWRLMFAIADLAGEDWGDQARAAAAKIELGADSQTSGVRLLAAIKAVKEAAEVKEDGIGSGDLAEKLAADPASEWHEYRGGKPISERQLANALKNYRTAGGTRIAPDRIRVGGRQVRGYLWVWFEDVWGRYLS